MEIAMRFPVALHTDDDKNYGVLCPIFWSVSLQAAMKDKALTTRGGNLLSP